MGWKNEEFIKAWGYIHRWHRKRKEREALRQQAVRDSILIPWEEYSKGTGWGPKGGDTIAEENDQNVAGKLQKVQKTDKFT